MATVKNTDIVQAKESPLKNIVIVSIQPIYPPCKVQGEFVEHSF